MNKGLKVAGLAVAGVVALTACEGGSGTVHYKSGKAGTVVGKSAKGGTYKLTTKSGGKKKTFEVFSSVYFDCGMFSYYPTCVKSPKPVSTPTKNGGVKNTTPKNNKTSPKKDATKKSSGFGGFKSGGFSSSKKR
ncbi:hypothetical protein SEA_MEGANTHEEKILLA_256 [Streptomyces phage MeganTheeKilla]|uniref:Lipoprotein n=1 Tax=Streptomyces phage MeganTheeKilla TaxID=2801897 RepID=A0A7U0J7I1_9CAUD|nr:hypothetical protein SEA_MEGANTHEEKILLA_256 [Streptomyces phage MeganTheeKilla]